MVEQVMKNNQVEILGEVWTEPEYSHEVFGEKFYGMEVKVPRLSDSFDYIPVLVSERLLDPAQSYVGKLIGIRGQFRSYNKHLEGRSKLILSVFARDVEFPASQEEQCPNSICLDGYVCKDPIYRKTPLGREITDLLLAVNRPYNKSDYIPAIAWGRNARFAAGLEVGSRVRIWGRIQSRVYQKKTSEDTLEQRIAYEVSVAKIEVDRDEDNLQWD